MASPRLSGEGRNPETRGARNVTDGRRFWTPANAGVEDGFARLSRETKMMAGLAHRGSRLHGKDGGKTGTTGRMRLPRRKDPYAPKVRPGARV